VKTEPITGQVQWPSAGEWIGRG